MAVTLNRHDLFEELMKFGLSREEALEVIEASVKNGVLDYDKQTLQYTATNLGRRRAKEALLKKTAILEEVFNAVFSDTVTTLVQDGMSAEKIDVIMARLIHLKNVVFKALALRDGTINTVTTIAVVASLYAKQRENTALLEATGEIIRAVAVGTLISEELPAIKHTKEKE